MATGAGGWQKLAQILLFSTAPVSHSAATAHACHCAICCIMWQVGWRHITASAAYFLPVAAGERYLLFATSFISWSRAETGDRIPGETLPAGLRAAAFRFWFERAAV